VIKTLYNIGLILKEQYPEYFEPWSNPFPNQEAKVIVANIHDGKVTGELEFEDYRSEFVNKYLYRKVQGANGTNLVPTLFLQVVSDKVIQKGNLDKLIKKIKQSVKNYEHNFIDDNSIEEIKNKITEMNLDYTSRYLFTMKIDGKYFGEYDEYRNLFYSDAYSKYSRKSSAKNKLCSVTYANSDEVWGRVDTLGFTIDDITFSRNGFIPTDSYKMFPASPDAVKILEGSKRIVLEKFSSRQFYFSGLNYFALPHFVNMKPELMKEIIEIFLNKVKIELTERNKSLINNEVLLNEIINDEKLSKNNVYYDIFFYQINNAQFLIKLHLSDVLPSRLKNIFKIKNDIETNYNSILKRVFDKGKANENIDNFFITFNLFKKYFSDIVNKKTIFQPTFFKLFEAVFYGNYLNEEVLLKAFLKRIISDFKSRAENKYAFAQTVKESFALHQFLYQLNLFKNIIYMETTDNKSVSLELDGFINQHPNFFDSEYKKGVFMLGVLTSKLLAKQRSKLKNEPFLKNLNNLSIDNSEIKKILPKLINKIREYDISHYTRELEGRIAKALTKDEDLNKTEISYLFTLGIIMGNEFDKEFFKKLKEEDNQLT